MRDRERRLRRVATRLTVRQRLAALLAENPEDPAPDDDLLRGLTPVTWTELRRDAERVDQLRAATREGLARVESEITLLGEIAERSRTTMLLALLEGDLEYHIEAWSPRRAAADRALGTAVRRAVDMLRRQIDATRGGGGGAGPPSPEALLRAGILHAHHLLRALAIEAAAFTAELDADSLPPDLRAQADRCRTDLATLIDGISGDPLILLRPPLELTEPSEDFVAAMRRFPWHWLGVCSMLPPVPRPSSCAVGPATMRTLGRTRKTYGQDLGGSWHRWLGTSLVLSETVAPTVAVSGGARDSRSALPHHGLPLPSRPRSASPTPDGAIRGQ